ncbi:MAG: sugar phosphate isomerase/epimerase [Clostridia bacterium]|nr:sugar phosphate isomerase/epimerase [Clostridia bacterium]
MKREKLFISTIDPQAEATAKTYGLGLEIAEYCTAWNMDEKFDETDAALAPKLRSIPRRVFHGPFNELFPCAIDPKARQLAAYRYRQAISLAKAYGAEKVVIHGGFNPWLYYPVWYQEQSILFWQDFLKEDPGLPIVLENVLEPEPQMLLAIIQGVNDPRLKMCLDVGHVNAYSKVPAENWLADCAPFIDHFHLHNNDGSWDTHSALFEGHLPMKELLKQAEALYPQATFTLELMEAEPSVRWLFEA